MTQAQDLSWNIPTPGQILAGKYRIEAQCGRGGLAVVFAATQLGLERRVAIKLLLPEWARDADVVERFAREGRAATRIGSEHVVRVFDVGYLDNGAPFLVLEYLEGSDLDVVLRRWGPLRVPTAVDWMLQAAEAIAEAHSLGIIHRDLKPANLFLTRRADGSELVKVIDFGLSKIVDPAMRAVPDRLTRPTDVMGSPHYMAPEQLRSPGHADARTDVWGLGAVLHELIVGRPPFSGSTMGELCAAVLSRPPESLSAIRSDVPAALEGVILRCLAKDPGDRYSSVAELARAVAPFGSPAARASRDRIERLSASSPRLRELSSLPPLSAGALGGAESTYPSMPAGLPRGWIPGEQASARVIVGALLIFVGLGSGTLMALHHIVHAHDTIASNPDAIPGITMMQPASSQSSAPPSSLTPPPPRAAAPVAGPPLASAGSAVPPLTPSTPAATPRTVVPSPHVAAAADATPSPAVPSMPVEKLPHARSHGGTRHAGRHPPPPPVPKASDLDDDVPPPTVAAPRMPQPPDPSEERSRSAGGAATSVPSATSTARAEGAPSTPSSMGASDDAPRETSPSKDSATPPPPSSSSDDSLFDQRQ